jgi:hypothetical protein
MSTYSKLRRFCGRLALIASFVLLGACGPTLCSKRSDIPPENQLHRYIELAVNITRMEQREELESLTTGEFRDQLSSASPEAFKRSYLDRRYDFEDFEVTDKRVVRPDKEVHLEYRVKFRSWYSGEEKTRAPQQDIKSLAVMNYTNGQWAIASIRPLDSTFNFEFGLPLEGVSTQGVTEDSPVVDPYAENASQNQGEEAVSPQAGQPVGAPAGSEAPAQAK